MTSFWDHVNLCRRCARVVNVEVYSDSPLLSDACFICGKQTKDYYTTRGSIFRSAIPNWAWIDIFNEQRERQ